jgi:hypothetical protein
MMARYWLKTAVVGTPQGWPYGSFEGGRTVADKVENAGPGDLIWPEITGRPNPDQLGALDDAAVAAFAAVGVTTTKRD